MNELSNINILDTERVLAIKVMFTKELIHFGESFIEPGMIAWLTKVDMLEDECCYLLHFDFSEFEQHNEKYFTQCYYSNIYTEQLQNQTGRKMFTAREAHDYTPKLAWYFGDLEDPEKSQIDAQESMIVLAIDTQ